MKELFEDILAMEDVHGVVLSSLEGEILFAEPSLEIDESLPLFIRMLGNIREADMIFEKSRVYVRRTDTGYLVIQLGPFASGAMLYVVFGELLPESILMWKSKLPAAVVILGLLTGLIIIYL